MAKNKRSSKARFVKELEENPFIERACKKMGISRATFYRWRSEDLVFRYNTDEAQRRGRAKINDFAESKLIENIQAGQHQAIVFWLRNNDKRYRPQAIRVYIEENDRQKVDLQQMQALLEELVRLRGVDALIESSVPDPEAFKENLRKELEELRRRSDEL